MSIRGIVEDNSEVNTQKKENSLYIENRIYLLEGLKMPCCAKKEKKKKEYYYKGKEVKAEKEKKKGVCCQ